MGSNGCEPSDLKRFLEAQLRECYGRVVYSHKTQEKCADILLARLSNIKILQIILSALTTSGLLAALLGSSKIGTTAGLVFSTLLLCLNSYTKNYDLGELAQKHKQAANNLWLIREKYLSLLVDLSMGNKPFDTIQKERNSLLDQLHSTYAGAPTTNYKAYRKAQAALKIGQDMTFSEEEIDAFLPKEMRKNQQPTSSAAS